MVLGSQEATSDSWKETGELAREEGGKACISDPWKETGELAREDTTNETRLLAREGSRELIEVDSLGKVRGFDQESMYAWKARGLIQASRFFQTEKRMSLIFLG
jgi:hypothetical protein